MEPEYIERKVLDKALTAAAAHDKDKNRRTWAKAICILHDLPAADVVPVVHCRHCRSYNKPRLGWCSVHLDREGPDDFCSYGKYQTNGGNSDGQTDWRGRLQSGVQIQHARSRVHRQGARDAL